MSTSSLPSFRSFHLTRIRALRKIKAKKYSEKLMPSKSGALVIGGYMQGNESDWQR